MASKSRRWPFSPSDSGNRDRDEEDVGDASGNVEGNGDIVVRKGEEQDDGVEESLSDLNLLILTSGVLD